MSQLFSSNYFRHKNCRAVSSEEGNARATVGRRRHLPDPLIPSEEGNVRGVTRPDRRS